MITRYKEKWNKMCDRIDILIKTANDSVAKKKIVDSKIANKIRMFFIHNTPSLYQFVSLPDETEISYSEIINNKISVIDRALNLK